MRKLLASAAAVAALLVVFAAPAAAATADPEDVVILSGTAVVAPGETVGDVVVFHGSARIDGAVTGDLVVFDGPATISASGTVDGDAIVFNGPLRVEAFGVVGGDVFADDPDIALAAEVHGDVRNISALGWIADGRFAFLAGFAVWLAVTLSFLALGLIVVWLAPRAVDATVQASRTGTGATIGWGLALLIGLPALAVVAMVTLVGIPFGLGLLLSLSLIYAVGNTASAWILGRVMLREPRSRALAFVAGWAILAAASAVPFLGGLVWFAATVFGLGAIVVATWRSRATARAVPTTTIAPSGPAAPSPA